MDALPKTAGTCRLGVCFPTCHLHPGYTNPLLCTMVVEQLSNNTDQKQWDIPIQQPICLAFWLLHGTGHTGVFLLCFIGHHITAISKQCRQLERVSLCTVKIRLPDLGAVYGTYTCLRWRQIHLWTLLPMVSPSSFCAFFNYPMHRTGHEIHPDRAVPGPEDHKNPPRLGKEIQGGQYWQLKHAIIHWNTSILKNWRWRPSDNPAGWDLGLQSFS